MVNDAVERRLNCVAIDRREDSINSLGFETVCNAAEDAGQRIALLGDTVQNILRQLCRIENLTLSTSERAFELISIEQTVKASLGQFDSIFMFRRDLVVHVLHRVDDAVMCLPVFLLHRHNVFRRIFLPLSTVTLGGFMGFILNLLIISDNLHRVATLLFDEVYLVLNLVDDVFDFFFDFVESFLCRI